MLFRSHTVTATFTLPATTLGGAPLDVISSVDMLCDGKVVASETQKLQPGAQISITHTDAPAGAHTYSIICHNAKGVGSEVKGNVFVGFAAPVAPESVIMTEISHGRVLARWSAVTKDADGRDLTASDVKYSVYEYLAGDLYTIATDVEGTSFEYDAFAEFPDFDDQRFVQTIVEAVTEGGVSKKTLSTLTPVGKPYAAPWSESFANCKINSIFANEVISGADVWKMVPTDDFGTRSEEHTSELQSPR